MLKNLTEDLRIVSSSSSWNVAEGFRRRLVADFGERIMKRGWTYGCDTYKRAAGSPFHSEVFGTRLNVGLLTLY